MDDRYIIVLTMAGPVIGKVAEQEGVMLEPRLIQHSQQGRVLIELVGYPSTAFIGTGSMFYEVMDQGTIDWYNRYVLMGKGQSN